MARKSRKQQMKLPNRSWGVSSPTFRRERSPSEAKHLRFHPRAYTRGISRRGITLTWVLSSIGKPIYFVLSRLAITLIFIFYFTGRTISSLSSLTTKISLLPKISPRKAKKSKRKQTKKTPIQFKLPKIQFPHIKFPNISDLLRLEKLRISLFEIKIISRFKKIFARKITHFQKLQFKKRAGIVSGFLIILSLIFYFYFFIFHTLPSPKQLGTRKPQISTKIYDRNGNLLYKIYKDQNRTIVPLTQIPIHVRLATLAAEDAEFYNHPGFSIKGIARAILQDIQTGSLQGGSTITQQLVKNVLLSPEKTLTRKIKEIILSVEVEATYTKDQILEMYLNQISYGGTAYGIEEASVQYFGKDVGNLDLAESAFLAGLTKSPTSYSPYGQSPDSGFERQREVLRLMTINKFITKDQENATVTEKLTFAANKNGIKAPHFVMYIRSLLVNKYGEEMVEKGGLEVTTSLDLSIQEKAENIVNEEIGNLKNLNVGNGDALVLNPQTGEILAMVGSADYFDTKNDGNVNVTLRLRQPGSSIKVINYAYVLSHGMTPASIIDDSPITYVTPGSPPYSPVNYDGQYHGKISLRSALAESRNIPAVKILASYGVSKMVDEGTQMGITSWTDPNKFGLSLTLGGGAVTALDLSKAYSTIANYGSRPDIMPILQVKDYKGRVLEKNTVKTTQVLDPRVAFTLTDILKDNYARSREFGLNSYLVVKDHPEVAVKTGTSNNLRDNWAAGYNQNFLVITWVGNNNNSPMSRIASGITGASPIWNKIMTAILVDQPSIDWKAPEGVSRVNICSITGTLPCDSCPTRQEWFLDENRPTKACSVDQIQKIVNPESPPIHLPNGPAAVLENGASTIR